MTATAAPQPGAVRSPQLSGVKPSTLATVLRSEWIKIRTVRSTFITLGVMVLVCVGLGALIAWAAEANYDQHSGVFDPTRISLVGLLFAQLAVAVLGALVITSEYSTGMIRTSLIAVPRRARLLGAKAAVFTAVILVVGEISSFVSFELGQVILSSGAPHASLGQPHVLRAVIGGGLYLAMVGLLSVGVGALVRNTGGAIAILVAFLFVVPLVLAAALPASIEHPFLEFWPSAAGEQVLAVHRDSHTMTAWLGYGWMALFTAVILALATLALTRRDA